MATRREIVGGLATTLGAAVIPPVAAFEANVVRLGADPTGVRNSTDAFQAAAQVIEKAGGGRLVIPPGRYRVGRQTFAGAPGKGFAYRGETIVGIAHCAGPVEVLADGASLFMTEGLRYGSFDPATGAAFTPDRMPFEDRDHTASIGTFFDFDSNADVRVSGLLTLDGASERQILGGRWGDVGRQLPGPGLRAYNNRAFSLKGLRSQGQPLDDLMIGWEGLTTDSPPYPHTIEDVQGVGAGRNGLSWVGGNSLTVTDCRFQGAGGRGGPVDSPPGAGIDIEAEHSICRNGVFRRVQCIDNGGAGLVADSGDSADLSFSDCQFVGVANWCAWPAKPRMAFERCLFVGPMVRLYGVAGHPEDAARFIDCVNTLDPSRAPGGKVYGRVSDFTSGAGVLWQGGQVDLAAMAGFNSAGGRTGTRWRNTRIVGRATGPLYVKGVFEGDVDIDYPNGVWDPGGGAVIDGAVSLHARPTATSPALLTHLTGSATQ